RTEAQVKNQAFMTANANYLNVSKFDAAHRRNLTGKNINFFVWDWFAGTQQANISKLTGLIPTSNIKGGLFNPNGDSHSANISWRGSSGWKHGQTVAGVLAQGAYEGNFYFVSTFSGSNLTSGANYINNIGGARGVVNMSFGGGFTPKSTLVTASGNYKHFLVMAAGNNSAPNPSMPAAWADQAGFNNGWYAVVATNPAGTSIASYSNRCGNTYSCFAMPAGVGGGTGLPGTSYAAPAFAAVVGVMAQAYPNLTNGQISRILAQTANDIGATGWDSTFGFGIPNLERALNPNASATYFANGSGQNVSFAGTPSYVSVNTIQSAFGSALGTPEGFSSEGEGMSVMMIDDLDRYFQMQSPVQVRNAREDIINKYTNFINPEIRSLKLNETKITETFSVKFDNNSMANLSTENTEMLLNELPITALTSFKVSKDVEATFGYTANLNNLFSNPNLAYEATDFITPEDFSNPYLGFIENIQSTASQMSFNLSDNLSARATGFTSDNNFGLEFAGSVLELNYKPTDNLFIGFKQGFLQENNSLFGVQTSGAFDFANNSNTMFTGLDLNYDVNSKWSLFASGFAGISSTSPAQNSAFSQVSDVITSAFNLGLSRKEIFGNDKLIMAFGQPLRVESGTARGTTLTMDEGGVVNQTSFAQTLAPNARALKIHTSYAKEIAEETDIIVSGEAVRNANHMTNNELDLTILGRVRHGF
ncbi:MAG: S8 family serine peptidase, partial [Rickettsiales bacterium]|nr:S8 family serine peptidase [Rickettsiales bacterium]